VAKRYASYYDSNVYLLGSAVKQALEAKVGFAFLALGALGQLLGQTSWFKTGSARAPLLLALAGVALLLVSGVAVRMLGRTLARRATAQEWQSLVTSGLQDANSKSWLEAAIWVGNALELQQLNGESDTDYVVRITTKMQEWGAKGPTKP
jgi:hypothetical protein